MSETSLTALVKEIGEALLLDDSNDDKAAYKKYASCIYKISTNLILAMKLAGGDVVVDGKTSKQVKLMQQCVERVIALLDKMDSSKSMAPRPQSVVAVFPDRSAVVPHKLRKDSKSDFKISLPASNSAQISPQVIGGQAVVAIKSEPSLVLENNPHSYSVARSHALTPMEVARKQNHSLMAAYKARMERLNRSDFNAFNYSLTIQRKMAENIAIAQGQEEELARKMQARNLRLEQEAAKRFATPVGMSKEEQEQRQIYKKILEYENEAKWLKNWRCKLEASPEDPVLISQLVQEILRCSDHPFTELLHKYQFQVYQRLYPLVANRHQEVDVVQVPLPPSTWPALDSVAELFSDNVPSSPDSRGVAPFSRDAAKTRTSKLRREESKGKKETTLQPSEDDATAEQKDGGPESVADSRSSPGECESASCELSEGLSPQAKDEDSQSEMGSQEHPELGTVQSDMSSQEHPELGTVQSDMGSQEHPELGTAQSDMGSQEHPELGTAQSKKIDADSQEESVVVHCSPSTNQENGPESSGLLSGNINDSSCDQRTDDMESVTPHETSLTHDGSVSPQLSDHEVKELSPSDLDSKPAHTNDGPITTQASSVDSAKMSHKDNPDSENINEKHDEASVPEKVGSRKDPRITSDTDKTLESQMSWERRQAQLLMRQVTKDYTSYRLGDLDYDENNLDYLFDDDGDEDDDGYGWLTENEHLKAPFSQGHTSSSSELKSQPQGPSVDRSISHTPATRRDLGQVGEIPQFQSLPTIIDQRRVKDRQFEKLSHEAYQRHLQSLSDDIQRYLEKLLVMMTIAYEPLDTPIGKDQCAVSLEEPFFKPLWQTLLRLFRVVNHKQELVLACVMTTYADATPEDFRVSKKLWLTDSVTKPYQSAVSELINVKEHYTMLNKLECVVKVCRLICECVDEHYSQPGSAASKKAPSVGADDLLPILTYVIVQSRMPQLSSECHAMTEFIHEGYMMGEEGYCLTSLRTALNYVISMFPSLPKSDLAHTTAVTQGAT